MRYWLAAASLPLLWVAQPANAQFSTGLCTGSPPFPTLAPGAIWNGWGPDTRNTRFQPDTSNSSGRSAFRT